MSQLLEIRWHGRAGQGVVTAGELLGEAAMDSGKFFQSFPEYGAERMGAPIKSYTRISDEPIEIHSPVLEPDVVVVVNPNLVGVVDLAEGLKPDGMIIMNTPESPQRVREMLKFATGTVWAVDATKIAMEEFKRDIPSTMLLSVIAKATGIVEQETVIELTREHLGSKLRAEVVKANILTLERAYEECTKG
jgi:pyruvate ferredoxin oxidoreductase gamma subunit